MLHLTPTFLLSLLALLLAAGDALAAPTELTQSKTTKTRVINNGDGTADVTGPITFDTQEQQLTCVCCTSYMIAIIQRGGTGRKAWSWRHAKLR